MNPVVKDICHDLNHAAVKVNVARAAAVVAEIAYGQRAAVEVQGGGAAAAVIGGVNSSEYIVAVRFIAADVEPIGLHQAGPCDRQRAVAAAFPDGDITVVLPLPVPHLRTALPPTVTVP